MGITCDRCGREMNDSWEIKGMPGTGGCCDHCSGNLCSECADWDAMGFCKYCAMSVEELEFTLPLDFQRTEKKEMPCSDCKKECDHTVTYEQEIWRSDNYNLNNKKSRQYQITYRNKKAYSQINGKSYFQTERYKTLREVLIDAHKMLDSMGIKKG